MQKATSALFTRARRYYKRYIIVNEEKLILVIIYYSLEAREVRDTERNQQETEGTGRTKRGDCLNRYRASRPYGLSNEHAYVQET